MKIVKKEPSEEFKPFDIVITIENESEQSTLKKLFNNSSAHSLEIQAMENSDSILNLKFEIIVKFLTEIRKSLE